MDSNELDKLSNRLRKYGIDKKNKKICLTNYINSQQSSDFSLPSNCSGYGRIHHFRRNQGDGWPLDPLPIDPALHALGLPKSNEIQAEVFQCAICNFRCWYCYVDRNLINANPKYSKMISVEDLFDLYMNEEQRPHILDLSGGQPDLIPEFILWFADTINKHRLTNNIYVWSDDNLSSDYLFRYLKDSEIKRLSSYKNYGRVGCFKGFDRYSFAFNTGASPEIYDMQFSLMHRVVKAGFDVYGYITLTTDKEENISLKISKFMDKLQSEVHHLFPLRTIPQRIIPFSPTKNRIDVIYDRALELQNEAAYFWQEEIEKRFSIDVRGKEIYEHKINI